MVKPKDYTGQRFGRLTAIEFAGRYHVTSGNNKFRLWRVQCDCGKIIERIIDRLVSGRLKSCGCLVSTRTPLQVLQHAVFTESTYGDGNLTENEFIQLSQLPCFYCGSPPGNHRKHRFFAKVKWSYSGLDRIDQTKPHNRDNVVPCCWQHNNQKKKMSQQEFLDNAMSIVMYQVKKEIDGKYETLRLSMHQPGM